MLGGPELQLSRIRAQAGPNGVLTEYNPNYEFSSVSSRDLKKIPRENLQLVRYGEVRLVKRMIALGRWNFTLPSTKHTFILLIRIIYEIFPHV